MKPVRFRIRKLGDRSAWAIVATHRNVTYEALVPTFEKAVWVVNTALSSGFFLAYPCALYFAEGREMTIDTASRP